MKDLLELGSRLKVCLVLVIVFLMTTSNPLLSQGFVEKMKVEDAAKFEKVTEENPFSKSRVKQRNSNYGIKGDRQFLDLSLDFNKKVLTGRSDFVRMALPLTNKENLHLNLKEVKILSEDFILTNSRGKIQTSESMGKFFWGYVEGYPYSIAAINVFQDEISGTIDLGEKTFTLTKIKGNKDYILYQEKDLQKQPELACHSDNLKENINLQIEENTHRSPPDVDNCVRMYIEIDHDLFLNKGSVAATYNYFAGAFSQVAILYANEQIQITLNQVKVWDEVDPYVGPSTGDYLNQFQGIIGPNFNGTLAHLVGTKGSGGIAYVNVVCNKANGFGYSGINTSYNNVPSYSWTVNVLTHEIGHNLGSSHTHACVWNGDNTQIDDCGNQVINNPGTCYDSANPIIPAAGGTIMSYCHLRSVGMDFNLGFGTQPGDLIRDRVHNGACLSVCVNCPQFGNACDDGDPCTTDDAYDSYCECRGIPALDLDEDGICAALDADDNDICIPNSCDNCTITSITIVIDNWPSETSWEIRNAQGGVIFQSNGYGGFATKVTQVCIDDGCYDFVMLDSYGDGICCAEGNGSYSVTDPDGNILASGGEFASSETTNFCYSNFTGCDDADDDDICDDVDPCFDPMVMGFDAAITSGTYNARQEIIFNAGTTIPENATIYLKSPSIKFMQNVTIPANATIELSEVPCEN